MLDRFWSKVDIRGDDECWLWLAGTDKDGYGCIAVDTRRSGWSLAHRFAWELHNRVEVPDGLVVDHTCRNTSCVNPAHLRAVTQKTNSLENSAGPAAINSQKTHCKNGHEFSASNTRTTRHGHRVCRTCVRHSTKQYRLRNKEFR